MAMKKLNIAEATGARALTDEIWEIVARRHVDRKVAISAVEMVVDTLRLDERIDRELGLTPKGKPS
jgi:hypothetical protein